MSTTAAMELAGATTSARARGDLLSGGRYGEAGSRPCLPVKPEGSRV